MEESDHHDNVVVVDFANAARGSWEEDIAEGDIAPGQRFKLDTGAHFGFIRLATLGEMTISVAIYFGVGWRQGIFPIEVEQLFQSADRVWEEWRYTYLPAVFRAAEEVVPQDGYYFFRISLSDDGTPIGPLMIKGAGSAEFFPLPGEASPDLLTQAIRELPFQTWD